MTATAAETTKRGIEITTSDDGTRHCHMHTAHYWAAWEIGTPQLVSIETRYGWSDAAASDPDAVADELKSVSAAMHEFEGLRRQLATIEAHDELDVDAHTRIVDQINAMLVDA